MSNDRNLLSNQQLLDDFWEELESLEGVELDEYLASLDLMPAALLQVYAKALASACATPGKARFEEAKRQVRERSRSEIIRVRSLDLARKKKILGTIRDFANQTHGMTIAARNLKIDAEGDIDHFLEACLRLGVIDSEGNLIG